MPLPDVTEQRLLEAAGHVFAEKGFKEATVREICQRAEANVAAVNYHYGSKEGLYREALQFALRSHLERLPRPEWPAGTPAARKLRGFLTGFITHMLDEGIKPWQLQLLMRELGQPGPAGEELVQRFFKPIYETLWGLLRDVLPPGADPVKLHLVSFSIVGQCFYQRVARPVITLVAGPDEARGYTPALLAEHIANFSLAALGLEPLQARSRPGKQPGPGRGHP